MTLSTKPLASALDALAQSIAVTQPFLQDKKTSAALRETLKAGVIQHFEFCYELCWKTLKRKLELTAANTALIDTMSYQELIREGAEKGLLDHPEKWFEYRRHRNLTSHTYHAETANAIYHSALAFYPDAKKLLEKLQEK